MLSEEEKKAIKMMKVIVDECELDNKRNGYEGIYYDGDTPIPYKEYKTILNLINKLQNMINGKECIIETQSHNEEVYEYYVKKLERKVNNQKCELAILNEKQKDMNKLINDVKSYKGQFKRQEKEISKYKYLYKKALHDIVIADKHNIDLKNQIDLMAKSIFKKFKAQLVIEYGIENTEQFIKLFENKLKGIGEQ